MPKLTQPVVATGTHTLRKAYPSHLQEYQWDVNTINQVNFTSNHLIKLTYRHAPRNETLESVFFDYTITNNSGADVEILPLFAGAVRECRVYINNKRVIDWNREEQARTSWNVRQLTRFDTDKHRDNYYYIETGEQTALDGGNLLQPVTLPAGVSRQFHLNFDDLFDIFDSSLPLHKVGVIEVELNLSPRGDYVCNPPNAIGDLEINNIEVYSRHKQYAVPPSHAMSHFTMLHYDYDVLTLTPSQHPFSTTTGQEFDINIHNEFPRRRLISRIIVTTHNPADIQAFRRYQQADSISSMELLRGGLTMLGTEYHYNTKRKIYKEVSNWAKRHHCIHLPTHNGEVGHNENYLMNFIDCSTIQHNQNIQASADTKEVELDGIDNFSNLVLRLTNDALLPITCNLVILLEFMRFDRLMSNGAVLKIQEGN